MTSALLISLTLIAAEPTSPNRLAKFWNRKPPAETPSLAAAPPGHVPLHQNQPPVPSQERPTAELLTLLREPAWVLRPRQDTQPLAMTCPWHHPAVTILAQRSRRDEAVGAEVHRVANQLLESGSDIEQLTAALLLAERDDSACLPRLASDLMNSENTIAARCLAAHALARFPAHLDPSNLEKLLASWMGSADRSEPIATKAAISGESAELVAAVAWALVSSRLSEADYNPTTDPWIDRFSDWPYPSVRHAAAAAHQGGTWHSVPRELDMLLDDAEPIVRRAALAALTRHPTAVGRAIVLRMSSDNDLAVARLAIEQLALYPDLETTRRLTELQSHPSSLIRESVIRAAGKLGQTGIVFSGAEDPSANVRAAAAIAIANQNTNQAVDTLVSMVTRDRSTTVQAAVVDGLASADPVRAVPILFAALESSALKTREHAAATLERFLPAASQFPTRSSSEERADALASLKRDWSARPASQTRAPSLAQSNQTSDPPDRIRELVWSWHSGGDAIRRRAEEELRQLPPTALALIEREFLAADAAPSAEFQRQALSALDPAYASICQLTTVGTNTADAAASNLAADFSRRPMTELQAILIARAAVQSDARSVWYKLVPLLLRDHGGNSPASTNTILTAAVDRVLQQGLRHAEESVRHAVCEHLADSPAPRHAEALAALMADPSERVRRAAIRAAGATADTDLDESLRHALRSPSMAVQLEAAAQLCRQGDREGLDAMRRLMVSPDVDVRRRVLTEVAASADVADRETVLRILTQGLSDSRLEVREQAIQGLETAVGHSTAGSQATRVPHDEQLAHWKRAMASLLSGEESTPQSMDLLRELERIQDRAKASPIAN